MTDLAPKTYYAPSYSTAKDPVATPASSLIEPTKAEEPKTEAKPEEPKVDAKPEAKPKLMSPHQPGEEIKSETKVALAASGISGASEDAPAKAEEVKADEPKKTEAEVKVETDSARNKIALTREKKLLEEKRAAQALRDEASAKAAKAEAFEKLKLDAKGDPIKGAQLLAELGLNYKDIVNGFMKVGKPETVEDQVKNLQKQLGSMEQQRADQEIKRLEAEKQAAIDQGNQEYERFASSVIEDVSKAVDKYPNIAGAKAAPMVMKEIDDHFLAHQKILTADEAAKIVEDRLSKAVPDEVKRLLAIPSIRALVEAELGVKKQEAKNEAAKTTPKIPKTAPVPVTVVRRPTLSNALTASAASTANLPKGQSRWEAIREARFAKKDT